MRATFREFRRNSSDTILIVDGDGRGDLIGIAYSGSQMQVTAYLSTGLGFATQPTANFSSSVNLTAGDWVVGDFNGDGRADVVGNYQGPPGGNGQDGPSGSATYISTGKGFVQQATTQAAWRGGPDAPGTPSHVPSAADFNGDGRADVSVLKFVKHTDSHDVTTYDSFQPDVLFKSNGAIPDLLTQAHESLGGTTTVAYKPSSQWTNTNLPFIVQSVSSLVMNDGRGNQSTVTAIYAGGLWNALERRFLGFSTLTATLPCNAGEAACPINKSTFLQSLAAYSPVTQIEQRDGSNNLLRQANEEYTVNTATLPCTALHSASQVTVVDGATAKIARKTRAFDAYGNVTQLTQLGDTGISGDEITTATTFEPNTTAYLVNFPARVQNYAGTTATGTPLAQQYLTYDNAGSWTTPPLKGDATKIEDWLDQTNSLLASTAEYDSFGNRTAATDPLGDRSETVFDSTYHLFAIEAHDPLYFTDARHKTTASWDTVCGAQSSTHDLNNLLTSYT